MSLLPVNTVLGKLEIVEIYEHHDKPLLFACRNASDNLYLVVLEDETDEYDRWIYAGMSSSRFAQVRSGGISLYSAFRNAENGFVFSVTTYNNSGLPAKTDVIRTVDLRDEQLPEDGEALSLETTTLKEPSISLQRRAIQLFREYVELALEFPDQTRNEAPISVLSDIMRALQDTLISIGHNVSDMYKESKTPTRDLIGKMELSLIGVGPGSFKLEMASAESADMFGDTLLGDALDELGKLIALGTDEESLKATLTSVKPSVPKDYLKLLKSISKSRVDTTKLRWASANGHRTGESSLTSLFVHSAIQTIEEMVLTESNILNVTGKLTGAFTDREFEIETSEKTYRGKLDLLSVEASDVLNNAQLGKRYKAKLREVITRKISTDETTTKHYLMDVEEDSLS